MASPERLMPAKQAPSTRRSHSTPMNQKDAKATSEVYGNWVATAPSIMVLSMCFSRLRSAFGSFDMGKIRKYAAAMAVVVVALGAPFLVAAQTPQRSSPKYLPRLGDIMSSVQFRHMKLWAAGQKQNWELAAFELDQVKAGLEEAITLYTDIPVTSFSVIETPLKSMDSAISTKNSPEFSKSFKGLTAACNSCHQSIGRGFIFITVPTTSPFSNQLFSPR
jgi:hypothetical protein